VSFEKKVFLMQLACTLMNIPSIVFPRSRICQKVDRGEHGAQAYNVLVGRWGSRGLCPLKKLTAFCPFFTKIKDLCDSSSPCVRQTASHSHDQPQLLVSGGVTRSAHAWIHLWSIVLSAKLCVWGQESPVSPTQPSVTMLLLKLAQIYILEMLMT